MKKIINGKLYDTEKSELIVRFGRLVTVQNDFRNEFERWVKCELYKTKNDAWFEVVGIDVRGTQLNEISAERAKEIIKVDIEL